MITRRDVVKSVHLVQCGQIGLICLSSWQQIILYKWPKYFMTFWVILIHIPLYVKTAVATFSYIFGTIWPLFIPTSGHTDLDLLSPSFRSYHVISQNW